MWIDCSRPNNATARILVGACTDVESKHPRRINMSQPLAVPEVGTVGAPALAAPPKPIQAILRKVFGRKVDRVVEVVDQHLGTFPDDAPPGAHE